VPEPTFLPIREALRQPNEKAANPFAVNLAAFFRCNERAIYVIFSDAARKRFLGLSRRWATCVRAIR
jgi:hypothetical protein